MICFSPLTDEETAGNFLFVLIGRSSCVRRSLTLKTRMEMDRVSPSRVIPKFLIFFFFFLILFALFFLVCFRGNLPRKISVWKLCVRQKLHHIRQYREPRVNMLVVIRHFELVDLLISLQLPTMSKFYVYFI